MKILALLLCLVGTANAEQRVAGSFRDFSDGLDNYSAPMSVAVNGSPDLMNVVIDEPGQLTQRNGYISCGVIPGGATATNLYEYAKNDGSRNLIVTDNVSIWQTGDCVTYSTITTGLSSTAFPRFATALDKLWIVNGSTWPLVWDGSTLTTLDGLDGKPEGFKAKYITYWKSRIWLANTATAPSSVYFTSLTSSTGAIIAPDVSTQAWSALNQIYIARDDGSPLYGIKVYRDNLYAFKETGVSRIVFESDYNLSVQKNVTTIGSKFQESIVEMDDGLLRYVGRDGVYAFDGISVKRLSSKWYPTFQTIKQPSRSELYRLWDDQEDYTGILSSVTASYVVGSVSLTKGNTAYIIDTFADNEYTSNPVWTVAYTNGIGTFDASSGFLTAIGTGVNPAIRRIITPSNSWEIYGRWGISAKFPSANNTYLYYAFLEHKATGLTQKGYSLYFRPNISGTLEMAIRVDETNAISVSTNYVVGAFAKYEISRDTSGLFQVYANDQLLISSVVASGSWGTFVNYSSTTYTGVFFDNPVTGQLGADNIAIPGYNQNGVFTAEITTATGVSSWKTFEADETLNGQTITYEIRTGTSVYNTLLNPWTAITPGTLVSTTTDNYAQWRANFSTTDNSVTPLLDSASLGWITGDSSRSALAAINYQSRYWITASTSLANDYNDLVMVESKSPIMSYTRYNLPVSAFTIWNGNLYGAISNTAKIARLDYGSTDDGAAITSYWQSRDENYENPIFYKTINTQVLDYANNPANTSVSIGLSYDEGSTWENRTVNLGASTLSRNTAKLNYTPETALGFRTRIFNNTLGLGYRIYGLHSFGTMTNYYGD